MKKNATTRTFVEGLFIPYIRGFGAALKLLKDQLENGLYVRRDQTTVMQKGLYGEVAILDGSSGTATPDLNDGNIFQLETSAGTGLVSQSVAIASPENIRGGMAIVYVTIDETGGYSLTLAPDYKVIQGEFDTSPDVTNILYFTFNGSSTIDVVIAQRGE